MVTATVRFVCEGGFPERFLNEATACGVPLWGVTRDGISLYATCRAAQYSRLRAAARSASVRMRVCEKRGISFWLRSLRSGLLVGVMLFCVLLSGFSSRIWIIRVDGNTQLPEEQILQVVRSLGVYEGADFDAVDIPALQLTALERLPSLAWLAIRIHGSVVYVEVRERQPATPIENTTPANVVAACDGVIVRLEVTGGQASVKVGDAVTAGTLLISGVVDSKVGPLLKRASGVVEARTVHTVTITVPFDETVSDPTPRTVIRPELYVLGYHVPLYTSGGIDGSYTIDENRYPLCAYGRPLPIGIRVVRYVFDSTVHLSRTPDQTLAEAYKRLEKEIGTWTGRKIESQSISERRLSDAWELCAVYTCVEEIGVVKFLEMHDKTT